MVFGTFDIFHNGHKNFLKQAKKSVNLGFKTKINKLIVIIARDKTVLKVKGKLPRNSEKKRLSAIEESKLADKVILGNLIDKYKAIKKYKPNIICLGYDQQTFTKNLKEKLKKYNLLNTKIVRLKSYYPEKYKSSKFKIKKMNDLKIIQHKNFRLEDLKYKTDKKISQQILELQKKFNKKFSKDDQKKLAFSQKNDFVYNTTALEGNTFNYAETETLLSGVTVGGHTIKEENEILNQKEAWKFTLNSAFQNLKIEMTENLIKDIHWRAGKDTIINPGQYRTGRVKISGTNYAPPKTSQEIENLFNIFLNDFKNLKEKIYLKAIIVHFVIALIQPFFDGNKRTARLLMNFILLQNSYPLFSIPVKIRQEYITAMIKGYENLDISELVELLSELMAKNLEEIV